MSNKGDFICHPSYINIKNPGIMKISPFLAKFFKNRDNTKKDPRVKRTKG
jgi:hypothetical protein